MTQLIDFVRGIFDSDFVPHAQCILWDPAVLWLHVGSDALTAAAYFAIPVALMRLPRMGFGIRGLSVVGLFSAFIFLCGLSHVLSIWTMWVPTYRLEGVVKAIMALVSVVTAVAVWPLIPRILALPNPVDLERANEAMRREMNDRRDAENRFRMLLEAAPDAMVIVDRDGTIEIVNDRCQSLFGYSKSDLVGQKIEKLVPTVLRELHVERRVSYVARPTPRPMGMGRNLFGLRSDGSEFPVEISLSPLETPTGLLVSSAIRDISARVEVERQLRELNNELSKRVDERTKEVERRAEDLSRSNRELEEFAYVVSHDLKSPMRGISSLSEWLIADQFDRLNEEGRQQLTLLKQRAARMHNLIEGVLTYSRAAAKFVDDVGMIDVADVLEEVIDALSPPSRIRIVIGDLPSVRYSRVQLLQVFQNLIGNAIEHMGNKASRIEIKGHRTANGVEFSVSDDGVGIPAEHHERIFRIFQTLSPREGDRAGGLGLAIAKKIVERNDGRIFLISQPGQRTTFVFTVPDANLGAEA